MAPFWPLQLIVSGRCQFIGRRIFGRYPVIQARGDRHDRRPGQGPATQDLAPGRLGKQLDTDLSPTVTDQLQYVGLVTVFAGGLNDDLHRSAIGKQSNAIVIARTKADIIKQGIGLCNVVAGPAGTVGFLVKRAFRQHRIGPFQAKPEIDHLVDLVPVNAQ